MHTDVVSKSRMQGTWSLRARLLNDIGRVCCREVGAVLTLGDWTKMRIADRDRLPEEHGLLLLFI